MPRHSRGSRPDRCHPVDGLPLARAQALGGASRERAPRHASRPRRRVHRGPRPRAETTPRLHSRRRGYSLTARAIALSVVLLILTISYATSLRIYFSQAHEIATTKAEIAERQQRIHDLQGELARWGDEAYVTDSSPGTAGLGGAGGDRLHGRRCRRQAARRRSTRSRRRLRRR